MQSKKNIVILTSRDNFVWTSMQEIIPMIEDSWAHLCKLSSFNLHTINVDQGSITQNMPELMASDLIVITCFNTNIAKAIKLLRTKLQIDTKFFFYLHGLATIALWPLQRFEVLNLFTTDDVFVGTCEGDIRSMDLSFKNTQSIKIPFTIIDPITHPIKNNNNLRPFVFIGRISPQKNLEHIIRAYSQLSDETKHQHPLLFFGTEDNLGYPNVSIKENNYLSNLTALVSELKLEPFISFRGFVEREEIQKELGNNYIFLSPSTHSDENFGMSAFRSLLSGVPCILSAWGGHLEFADCYPNQIKFVKTKIFKDRPGIDINELAKAMQDALKIKSTGPNYPVKFSLDTIKHLLELNIHTQSKKEKLEPKDVALKLFKQQKYFENNGEIQRCFNSFEDPEFLSFFEAYSVICLK